MSLFKALVDAVGSVAVDAVRISQAQSGAPQARRKGKKATCTPCEAMKRVDKARSAFGVKVR